MSWNRAGNITTQESAEAVGAEHASARQTGKRGPTVLPFPPDTRERLTVLYRGRDEVDAERYASGVQKVRGQVWATGSQRLERGDEVYESYGVLSSAGIDLPADAQAMLAELPADWRQICRIDADGVVRAASLKQRMRSGR